MKKMYLIAVLLIGAVVFSSGCIEGIESLFSEGDSMLKMHCYGASGKEIDCGGGLFSVVEGTEGIYYLSYDVKVTNTGDVALDNVRVYSASPSALANSLPTTSVAISPGSSYTFVGTDFETQPLESDTPVTFDVQVKYDFTCPDGKQCISDTGALNAGESGSITKSAYKEVSITADPELTVGATVDLVGEGGSGGGTTDSTTTTVTTDPGSDTDPTYFTWSCTKPFGDYYRHTFTYSSNYPTTCPTTIEYESTTYTIVACETDTGCSVQPGDSYTDCHAATMITEAWSNCCGTDEGKC